MSGDFDDKVRFVLRSLAFPVAVLCATTATSNLDCISLNKSARFATISSFTSISLSPNLVSFALSSSSKLCNVLLNSKNQTALIHFLSCNQSLLSDKFSGKLPLIPGDNPLSNVIIRSYYSYIPVLDNCLAVLAAKISKHIVVADHHVFIAQTENVLYSSDVYPLLYRKREYKTIK